MLCRRPISKFVFYLKVYELWTRVGAVQKSSVVWNSGWVVIVANSAVVCWFCLLHFRFFELSALFQFSNYYKMTRWVIDSSMHANVRSGNRATWLTGWHLWINKDVWSRQTQVSVAKMMQVNVHLSLLFLKQCTQLDYAKSCLVRLNEAWEWRHRFTVGGLHLPLFFLMWASILNNNVNLLCLYEFVWYLHCLCAHYLLFTKPTCSSL